MNMLRHVLGVLGMTSEVVRHDEHKDGDLDDYDLVVVGPGPGDPRDGDDPKMTTLRGAVDRLLEREQPFLAVCLGHQALCHRLGLPLAFKDIVFQGTQSPVVDRRPDRARRLLQHLRRRGCRRNGYAARVLPAGVDGRGRPGHRATSTW